MHYRPTTTQTDVPDSARSTSRSNIPSTFGVPKNAEPKLITYLIKKSINGPKMGLSLSRLDSIKPTDTFEEIEMLFKSQDRSVTPKNKQPIRNIKTNSPGHKRTSFNSQTSSILKKRTFKTDSRNSSNSPENR